MVSGAFGTTVLVELELELDAAGRRTRQPVFDRFVTFIAGDEAFALLALVGACFEAMIPPLYF